MSQATRAYLYRIVTAALPILTFYGVVADEVAPLYAGLGAAVLGTGVAALNTPR